MNEIEELDQKLARICIELDAMWKDIGRFVGTESVVKIGESIISLGEMRNLLHEKYPDLPKDEWDAAY